MYYMTCQARSPFPCLFFSNPPTFPQSLPSLRPAPTFPFNQEIGQMTEARRHLNAVSL